MNYSSFQTALQTALVFDSVANTDFANIVLPNAIEYAESRCYRDLDMLATRESATVSTVADTPTVSAANFIVIQSVESDGTPLQQVDLQALRYMFSGSTTGEPIYWANVTNSQIQLGPTPDDSYDINVFGTRRPAALSVSNPTTPLTTYCPDLFFAAAMVWGTGWQRDFGAQAGDPASAVSWEAQYKTLLPTALSELYRQKGQASAWSPLATSPVSTPTR